MISNIKEVGKIILTSVKQDKYKVLIEIHIEVTKEVIIKEDNQLSIIIRRDSKVQITRRDSKVQIIRRDSKVQITPQIKITKDKTTEEIKNQLIIFKQDKDPKTINSKLQDKDKFKEIKIEIEIILEAEAEEMQKEDEAVREDVQEEEVDPFLRKISQLKKIKIFQINPKVLHKNSPQLKYNLRTKCQMKFRKSSNEVKKFHSLNNRSSFRKKSSKVSLLLKVNLTKNRSIKMEIGVLLKTRKKICKELMSCAVDRSLTRDFRHSE